MLRREEEQVFSSQVSFHQDIVEGLRDFEGSETEELLVSID
jgi:hypothetical protein